MKFKIEQVALYPRDPKAAIELLTAMGMAEWAHDHVSASGVVFGRASDNEADLAFNYQGLGELGKPGELEVLHYTEGYNWMQGRPDSVSHFGMHCSQGELNDWRVFFSSRGIVPVQEVDTSIHTNPVIAGKRWYHYCIFGTRHILGVDIKFIVRKDRQ